MKNEMKVLQKSGEIKEVGFEEREGKNAFWHTSAHVLAQAVKRLYPDTKCGIGPATENGFYYDFAFSFPFLEEHLQAVEKEMKAIVKESLSLQVQEISKAEAAAFMEKQEEAKARDHRKLGRELGLFAFMEEGPGFPFFLPKGLILKNLLIDYWRNIHAKEGYVEIATPVMLSRKLWEISGHWEHYHDNMYTSEIDGSDYALKPMNCPGGMLVYKSQPRSYKELPLRIGELGLVHRFEKSGQLHGLMRTRCFTQDDAHIFMTKEQVQDEICGVMKLIDKVYARFGFSYEIELSTRPENSIGSDEEWELATNALQAAAQSMGKSYIVNEGDGAFYGPKLDFHLKDSIGRTWQCGTIQLDFQLPKRFGVEYMGADGQKHRPIMLHRVVFGSIERFIGILIEHFIGNFPVWLSPVQVRVLSVSDKYLHYAQNILQELKENGLRAELDERDEKLGYKIREARMDKVPYVVIVGEKEQSHHTVSVRQRDAEPQKQDMGEMPLALLIELIHENGGIIS